MLGLTYDEMMHGDIDYIVHRFNGWAMLNRHREAEAWKQSRLVAFSIAKSLGATKAKKPEEFMQIDEGQKQSRLTPEMIEQMNKQFDKL